MARPRKDKSGDAPALTAKKKRAKVTRKLVKQPEIEAEDEAQPKTLTKSVIPSQTKILYGPEAHCGDELAVLLKGKNLDFHKSLASELGIAWNWDHLGAGMQIMNVRNRMRGMINKDNKLTHTIKKFCGVA